MAMAVQDADDVLDASHTRKGKRSTNYTEAEDIALVKAWEGVTLNAAATTGNDQAGKRYWDRIADRFHRLMMPEPSARSLRSLQGRYDVIKQSCSRWSGCLKQARNAPPSNCIVADYDDIAQETYKQMAASKGKAFVLQHCWKLLEHSEKWNLRDQEAPPSKKRRSNSLAIDLDNNNDEDDDGDDDDGGGGEGTSTPTRNIDDDDDGDDDDDDDGGEETPEPTRNIERPDGRRKGKHNLKKAETENMSEKINELINAVKEIAAQVLQMKELAEKKQRDKITMWQQIKEIEEKKMAVEKRKADLKERRLLLEENKMRQEIIAEENKLMIIDPNGMDEKTRACWEIRRGEILQSRMCAAGMRGGGSASGGGNGGDLDGGGNNGGDGNGAFA